MKNVFAVYLFAVLAMAGCSPEKNAVAAPPKPASASPAKPSPDAETLKDGVVAYYFHGNRRCRTCLGIQETIVNTIDTRFLEETTSGKLLFKEINIEEDANKHFVKEYEIAFSTLIVEARKNGKALKWENCGKVWDLSQNHAAMADYTEERIRSFLKLAAQ